MSGQDVSLEALAHARGRQRQAASAATDPKTVKELLDALECCVDEGGLDLIRQLRDELKIRLWPSPVFEVCLEIFGPSIHSVGSRLRLGLDRHIGHAQTVWNRKYGPLNPAQEAYLSSILCGAIRSGVTDAAAKGHTGSPIPFVLAKIDKTVNHEVVHAGFKRRAVVLDMRDELKSALG